METESLKTEIGQILDRYKIPMDDKGFILEKIESEIQDLSQVIGKRLEDERARLQGQVTLVAGQAKTYVDNALDKARNAVKSAYNLGRKETLGQASVEKPGMNWMQISITIAVLVIAGVFVIRELLPKRD
jgi:uncharacterized protein YjbJ (UPF0337 family)